MGNINIIVACGKNGEIGKDNTLPWHIKEDLQFFKKMTLNKTIVMGKNTYFSLPHNLPNRKYVVLSTSKEFDSEITVYDNFYRMIDELKKEEDEVFIIGGARLYASSIEYADKMYITEIDKEFDCDTYFPKFNLDDWDRIVLSNNCENSIEYKHVLYKRKGK